MNSETRWGWGSVAAALVVGLLIGWFAIGWGIWPVQWTNTDPIDLRQPAREEYLKMVASDYAITRNAEDALGRLSSWPSAQEAYREISELARFVQDAQGRADLAQQLRQLASVLPVATGEEPAQTPATLNYAKTLRTIIVAAAVVGLVALALLLFRRRSSAAGREPGYRLRPERDMNRLDEDLDAVSELDRYYDDEGSDDDDLLEEPRPTERREGIMPRLFRRPESKPEVTWDFPIMYAGEGMEFDQTFTLEDGGAYFGECGVGATTHLTDHPQQVSALEVWLFDKSDIRTIAKVLVSEAAAQDDGLMEELTARGDPEVARPGSLVVLEGNSIQAEVRVEEIQYMVGPLPEAAFAQVSLRIRASKR